MDLELAGRNVLITGGSSGLGLGLAHTLVKEGANVLLVGRNADKLDAAAHDLSAAGTQVLTVPADVRNADDLQSAIDTAEREWGRLDGLVNNAGFHTGSGFETTTDDEWQMDFELKLLAKIRGIRQSLPLLRKSDAPAVLNVLSIYARFQPNKSMPSSVYRAAGLALTNGLSRDLAADRIRVNALLIGFVHSDQWVRGAAATGADVEEWEANRAEQMRIPLGRVGRTEEFADVAAFLLSSRASYLTGTALNVDGGLSMVV
ncbi:NAD(P)-dependent dehydrogenase (short-subunit alcohol dehydrogenase family) [Antricoccus suffuscus]|uniref:NAD(P)-dependent dehydrogenase (Short-subunit alcohol dehydrogenase family) n=1 Tax=Antricoccus suffuscus TaxID=1629062 RepID=A0A2T1A5Q9_9ACTN|nr:SDR family oxidoreductase [Antricoccus suffuscus]PRZ43920.1 NAD(P)-dependent dehydrogenase (short-subunit alcohol dehydrogenase family) [Antricoccus suffuscus]